MTTYPTRPEKLFVQLSQLLTGVRDLDAALATDYYNALAGRLGPDLDELLGIYAQVASQPKSLDLLVQRIKNDPVVLNAAKQVARVWYVSQFTEPVTTGQVYAGHWERGALWDVIKAHPPAFSSQQHGYWAFKPK